jgi:hypothetical protein
MSRSDWQEVHNLYAEIARLKAENIGVDGRVSEVQRKVNNG